MSASWLASNINRTDLRVVDASWHLDGRDAEGDFERVHIPGAVFLGINAISDAESPLPHMLPAPDRFGAAVAAAGIDQTVETVVYDASPSHSAARLWWAMRTMGMPRVRVLDGGLQRWLAEGRPTDCGPSRPVPGRLEVAFRPELVCDAEEVRRACGAGVQIVDARPAARFHGDAPEPRPGVKRGHIPNSRNLPLTDLYTDEGILLAPTQLLQVFRHAGIDHLAPVIATCGSGIAAASIALALATLGHEDTAIYDGSWADWGSRDDVAIA